MNTYIYLYIADGVCQNKEGLSTPWKVPDESTKEFYVWENGEINEPNPEQSFFRIILTF